MSSDRVSGSVILKRGRSKPVQQHHPWVFSGAIERVEGDPADGDLVDVRDTGRNFLARGYINQRSQIVVRILSWDPDERIDAQFWRERIKRANDARGALAANVGTTAYRVVHAESDFLPGLIVDCYGEWLVIQLLTLGVAARQEPIVEALVDLLSPRGIYERSDVDVRGKEGLGRKSGLLWGDDAPETATVLENGWGFLVDFQQGHKTGFYLDQRENRALMPFHCGGADVLDAFAYSGGFSVYAASAGAKSLTLVDSSARALELARRNLALNGFSSCPADCVEGDVFSVLRGFRSQDRLFDVIVLDPPKFAHTTREVQRASRAYKDANLIAMQLLRPSGTLFTFSCSGGVSPDLFQKIVFGAALDARRDAQIFRTLSQGFDHPVALTFPEGAYLKGLALRLV